MSRILVVDDSRTQALSLHYILESEGFTVVTAHDGEEALSVLAGAAFDAVISDINMPKMSGYELCQAIRAHTEFSGLPVILLTARNDPADVIRGLESGADNFAVKPYNQDHLIRTLKGALASRQDSVPDQVSGDALKIDMPFMGEIFSITADPSRILKFFISAIENIASTNKELLENEKKLQEAKKQVEDLAARMTSRAVSMQERHVHVMDNMIDGITIVSNNGLIESVNPAAAALFNIGTEKMLGAKITQYIPSLLEFINSNDEFVDSEAIIGARETEGVTADGNTLPIDLAVSKMDIDGSQSYIIVTRDITDRRAVQSQLQQAVKMEAVGNLTGGIAHDFNNILAVLLGNLQLLERQVSTDEKLMKFVKTSITAVTRGADLTRQLLAFSRRQELDPKVIDVNDLVDSMTNLLGRTLGAQIEIKKDLASDLALTKVDAAQLESALLNLCVNARDAMPEGGKLVIDTSNAELDADYASRHSYVAPGNYVCISVTDTGEGIPVKLQEQIFQPFFTTKPVGKGTGLGLSMVFGFVKQTGGHINLYSEMGHGSRFRIYLPVFEGERSLIELAQVESDDLPLGSETVLLVEDDVAVRETTVLNLEALGYKVVSEINGVDALRALNTDTHFDLLFTDMVMPGGLNGHQMAIKATEMRSGIKVLLCSGYPRDAFAHGRSFYLLQKPYTREVLARTIRRILDEE